MQVKQNTSLKNYNTFGIECNALNFVEITEKVQIEALYSIDSFAVKRLVIGGGSNILLTKDFDGLVIKNSIKGIEVVDEDEDNVWVKAYSGESWHEFVMHCIENDWGGVENLSLIPGQVGAAPMQNIGAYGVEIKDVFHSLEAWDIENRKLVQFVLEDCEFGYRESVFKKEGKDKYIILSVTFKLTKQNHNINISYGAIGDVLRERNIENPSIKDVSDAVISIRKSKLPDPEVIGNAGSFFKNPEVAKSVYQKLQTNFPDIPHYTVDDNTEKIPAGWLIEKAGWKGKTFKNYGVHKNQALVLVNYGGANGYDIMNLAFDIQKDVEQKFGIKLTPEVNFI